MSETMAATKVIKLTYELISISASFRISAAGYSAIWNFNQLHSHKINFKYLNIRRFLEW